MALILSTARDLPQLSADERQQVYNGLDCCITSQVHTNLLKLLNPNTTRVYRFERDLQVVAMEMMLRGIRVDPIRKQEMIDESKPVYDRLLHVAKRLAHGFGVSDLNPGSSPQLKKLLYETLGLPVQYKIEKGERKPTANREALEALQYYYWAGPLVRTIMAWKDEKKQLEVLASGVDNDGKMRFSWNIGATETGRWSSSKNSHGTGTNGQNITDYIRQMFVPDPGMVFVNIDLVSAESFAVGYLARDWKYVEACETGDLHTVTAKLIWQELEWGDESNWRAVADQIFYRHFTYRDLSKRGGHASNYVALPATIHRHLHIPMQLAEEFQSKYFKAYPRIPVWHMEVQGELQTSRQLTTPLGRERQFFGRLDSRETFKEAVAYMPQSTIADVLNLGTLDVWRKYKMAQFLANGHDSFLVQLPIEHLAVVPQMAKDVEQELTINNRKLTIPAEASIGWNWGKRTVDKDGKEENPLGLRKWGKSGKTPIELDNFVHGLFRGDRVPAPVP